MSDELLKNLSLVIALFYSGMGIMNLYFSLTYSGSRFELHDNIRGITRTFKFGRSLLVAVCAFVIYFSY